MPSRQKKKTTLDRPSLNKSDMAKVDIRNKPPGITVSRQDWNLWTLNNEIRRQYGLNLDQFMPLLEMDGSTTLADLRQQVREIKALRLFVGGEC